MADNKWGRISGGMSELHSWNYPTWAEEHAHKVPWEVESAVVKWASEELLNIVDSLEKVKEILFSGNATQEEKEAALIYVIDRGGWLHPEEILPLISHGRWLRLFWIPMFGDVNTKAHEELGADVGKRNMHDEPIYDQMWESRRLAIFFESQWKMKLAKKIRDHRDKRLHEVAHEDRLKEGA